MLKDLFSRRRRQAPRNPAGLADRRSSAARQSRCRACAGTDSHVTRALAQLSVRRGPEAIAFYKAAFGAVVDYQVGDESIVAQLSIGADATFWVADESPEHANFSPETLGGGTVRMLLLVDDPDAAIAAPSRPAPRSWRPARRTSTAGASGASPIPVRAPLGDRQAARPLAALEGFEALVGAHIDYTSRAARC